MLSYRIAKQKSNQQINAKKVGREDRLKEKRYSILPAEDIQYKYLMNNNVDRR
jgi:hypothetical protein